MQRLFHLQRLRGQCTLTMSFGWYLALNSIQSLCAKIVNSFLGAQCELKIDVLLGGGKVAVFVLLHHAHGHDQAVSTDFGHQC